MGCSASTPEADGQPRPTKKQTATHNTTEEAIVLPEVTWQTDKTWSEWMLCMEKSSIESGRHDEFLSRFDDMVFHGARMRLEEQYPDCAASGSIADMGSCTPAVFDEDCHNPNVLPTKQVLVLDASLGGIGHAFVLMVAKPPRRPVSPECSKEQQPPTGPGKDRGTEEELPWIVPGAELDSPEMRAAKWFMLTMSAGMRSTGCNTGHTLIHIFLGADLVTCRFDPSPKSPTVVRRPKVRSKKAVKEIKWVVKESRKTPDAFQGLFAPTWLRRVIKNAAIDFPGSTVWDEGPFPLRLPSGDVIPVPTRLLVTRNFARMTGDKVDEVYSTVRPAPGLNSEQQGEPVTLVRKVDPTKDPGGIVRVSLVIGLDRDVVWPGLGDYANSPILKAGEEALVEYAKGLYAQGKLDRCSIGVYMGLEESYFHLVGDPKVINGEEMEIRPLPHPDEMSASKEGAAAALPIDDGSLQRDFNVEVTRQRRHELMGSESQFQAVKQFVREQSKTRTHREQNALSILSAPNVAKTWLEDNFPGCDSSDEGPFPDVLSDGTETPVPDTCLVVARDPKQEPHSVVAVIQTVPCPAGRDGEPALFSTKSWLHTPEMEEADRRLLALLKKWHKQGKVSEVDCMAQCMVGKDASIYKFVDGERFEDYSEERMHQLKWG